LNSDGDVNVDVDTMTLSNFVDSYLEEEEVNIDVQVQTDQEEASSD